MTQEEVFDPLALAICNDPDLDDRPDVQDVDADMIYAFVVKLRELPPHSARPFSEWAHTHWNGDFNEDGEYTNADVLQAMLMDWCGGRMPPTDGPRKES